MKRPRKKAPATPATLAEQVADHFEHVEAFHRLVQRVNGRVSDVDYKILSGSGRIVIRRGLSRRECVRVGIIAGAYYLAAHIEALTKKGGAV